MKNIFLKLPQKKIPILIEEKIGAFGSYYRKISPCKKALIITNAAIRKNYDGEIKRTLGKQTELSWAEIPAGERSKTLDTVKKLYGLSLKNKLNRNSVIIALGGGVVGDIAGFVAATFLRGIKFIQIPTTLLAMVDSSIGGKVGVDLPEGKNLVGAFYHPEFVFICDKFLKTLPPRELQSGLAEVVKYGVIKDEKLFRILEKSAPDKLDWPQIIERCAKIKCEVVESDEKETLGKRELLNFGHTYGHAVETITKYKKYTHGEGVAIGMIYECLLAEKLTKFKETRRVRNLLSAHGLPVKPGFCVNSDSDGLLKAISLDKKVRGKKIRLVLPSKIGKPVYLNLPVTFCSLLIT